MQELTSRIYIDEWFNPYFEVLGSKNDFSWRSKFCRGQFFWTYVFYSYENLELWRPKNMDETETKAFSFEIVSAGGDAFRRQKPLVAPPLETDEEFLVLKAKRRPVILLCPSPEELKTGRVRYGEKINRHLILVSPLYSLKDKNTEKLKYPPDFIEGVRLLKWPQFFFIPERKDQAIRESIVHLDSLMATPQNHLEPIPLKVAEEPLNLLLDQINFLLSGKGGNEYHILREQLLNP